MSTKNLKISGLKIKRQGKEAVSGVDINIPAGKLHVLMGPNGSGKSSLALALMGHPSCRVVSGRISLDNKSLLKMSPDARSMAGLFLSLQSPPEVSGVGLSSVLRAAINLRRKAPVDVISFRDELLEAVEKVGLPPGFIDRNLNENFSGGEKKRSELLQMIMLQPRYAILDEIDSGLDVDGLKTVAKVIEAVRKSGTGILLITHYERLLKLLKPQKVHVMIKGQIVRSGGPKLAEDIDRVGFRKFVGQVKK